MNDTTKLTGHEMSPTEADDTAGYCAEPECMAEATSGDLCEFHASEGIIQENNNPGAGNLTLRDYLRSYPWGLVGLSEATGLSRSSIYGFAAGDGKEIPWAIIREVVRAFAELPDPIVERWTGAQIVEAWQRAN